MDRREAIEALEYLISGECTDTQMDFIDEIQMAITDMKICEANNAGWISVKDRLPESGKHVLICCEIRPSKKKYVCDGYYASKHNIATHDVDDDIAYEYDEEADEYFLHEGWYEVIRNWDEYSSIVIADFVTYWMPLPKPPKEE